MATYARKTETSVESMADDVSISMEEGRAVAKDCAYALHEAAGAAALPVDFMLGFMNTIMNYAFAEGRNNGMGNVVIEHAKCVIAAMETMDRYPVKDEWVH